MGRGEGGGEGKGGVGGEEMVVGVKVASAQVALLGRCSGDGGLNGEKSGYGRGSARPASGAMPG